MSTTKTKPTKATPATDSPITKLKLPEFSPRMTAEALQTYAPRLDDNPFTGSDVGPAEAAGFPLPGAGASCKGC